MSFTIERISEAANCWESRLVGYDGSKRFTIFIRFGCAMSHLGSIVRLQSSCWPFEWLVHNTPCHCHNTSNHHSSQVTSLYELWPYSTLTIVAWDPSHGTSLYGASSRHLATTSVCRSAYSSMKSPRSEINLNPHPSPSEVIRFRAAATTTRHWKLWPVNDPVTWSIPWPLMITAYLPYSDYLRHLILEHPNYDMGQYVQQIVVMVICRSRIVRLSTTVMFRTIAGFHD